MSEPELLTTQELADLLRVPTSTIYQLNHKGTGPARIKVGRHMRYRRSAVEEWLRDQTIDPRNR